MQLLCEKGADPCVGRVAFLAVDLAVPVKGGLQARRP